MMPPIYKLERRMRAGLEPPRMQDVQEVPVPS